MIIDSFLLSDGRVTGFDRHVRRFGQATGVDIAAFISDFCEAAPNNGQWFPQWRYQNDQLSWLFRPAPSLKTTLRLGSVVYDERVRIDLKGPDLEWLTAQVDTARSNGADDVLIVGKEGVRETGTAAVVVWQDRQWLTPIVAMPSCTMEWFERQSVIRCEMSIDNVTTAVRQGRVLALNSLHGVRQVEIAGETPVYSGQMQTMIEDLRHCWFSEADAIK